MIHTNKLHPKTWFRFLASSLAILSLVLFIRGATGLLQGSDGTPDGTPNGFTLEPLSLVIGLAAGSLLVGVPALARSIKHRKDPPPREGPPDQDCDGDTDYARKGWDGTVKGSTKAPAQQEAQPSLINPIAMDKGLRFASQEASPPSGAATDTPVTSKGTADAKESGSGKIHTRTGHVTLMK